MEQAHLAERFVVRVRDETFVDVKVMVRKYWPRANKFFVRPRAFSFSFSVFLPALSIWIIFALPHVHSFKNMAKSISYSAFAFSLPSPFFQPGSRAFWTHAIAIESVFVTSSRRKLICFSFPISMPSPLDFPFSLYSFQIDNRLPGPPTSTLLLTPSLSSSKQTDCHNVASHHPCFRHGCICTPGRRRRRRHLSYMRGCLHMQQQNYRPKSNSLPIRRPSGPEPNLIPNNLFTIRSHSPYYGGAIE